MAPPTSSRSGTTLSLRSLALQFLLLGISPLDNLVSASSSGSSHRHAQLHNHRRPSTAGHEGGRFRRLAEISPSPIRTANGRNLTPLSRRQDGSIDDFDGSCAAGKACANGACCGPDGWCGYGQSLSLDSSWPPPSPRPPM